MSNQTIVIYGDSFAEIDRKKKATEIINKALAERRLVVGHDPGHDPNKREQYCTVHEDAFDAVSGCPRCEATDLAPKPTPSEILDDAIDEAEKQLGGIELMYERRMAERVYVVIAGCPHCGKRDASTSITELAIEKCCDGVLAGALVAGAKRTRATCLAGTCCDPLDRFVDGLRVRECLERYQAQQRRDDHPSRMGWCYRTGPELYPAHRCAESRRPPRLVLRAPPQAAGGEGEGARAGCL